MKIVVNFGPLKQGGGQNVGMNFLMGLKAMSPLEHNLFFLVAEGSMLHAYMEKSGMACDKYHVVPANPLLRLLKEIFVLSPLFIFRKVDVVYSCFGYGLFLGRVPQVSGSAVSNIYYPEIDFWAEYHGVVRFKLFLIDAFRRWAAKRAAVVIVENRSIERRAQEFLGLRHAMLVLPSIAEFESANAYRLPTGAAEAERRILFLCGWQRNKDVMLIPDIAYELMSMGKAFRIILSAPRDGSPDHLMFERRTRQLGVEHMISIVGPVDKSCLASLYGQVDFVMLLSKLESFSNNIIEAWYYRRPLVATDAEWAREICGDSACYVNRESARDIAQELTELDRSPEKVQRLVECGGRLLATYPRIAERTKSELAILESVGRAL
jgi:glycosyltransferase involved in cell wall biosynthesis